MPLEGGNSGETFVSDVAGERSVVRVYARSGIRRGSVAPEVDAAVLRLVRGLVPAPEVYEVRRGTEGAPGLLVTSYVAGERLDLLLPVLSEVEQAGVGTAVGTVLARLAQMPMLRAGMFEDGSLTLGEPGAAVLPDEALDLLDSVGRVSLVHGDFVASNVLVDRASLTVAAVVDWEAAHAGSPYTDLGTLLREEHPAAFADAVLAAFVERLPERPDAQALARAAGPRA